MKKGKKAGPKAFGVRLEDCLPGANNKVNQCATVKVTLKRDLCGKIHSSDY